MDNEKFEELLSLGHELAGIEFKGPGSRKDKAFAAYVIRACLGMANRRGGGQIVIGVIQSASTHPEGIGLSEAQASTWNHDEISDTLSDYADPSVSFAAEHIAYKEKTFVIITVSEFEDVPVICKKDYADILRKGACYVRPRRKPETSEIPTQEDMRDLLDLAVQKRLRSFISLANAAGMSPGTTPKPLDDASFEAQASDILG